MCVEELLFRIDIPTLQATARTPDGTNFGASASAMRVPTVSLVDCLNLTFGAQTTYLDCDTCTQVARMDSSAVRITML